MTVWLHVIGVGEGGAVGLTPAALSLINDASVVFGGTRHLDLLRPVLGHKECIPWPSPFAAGLDRLEIFRGRTTVVLASGDPIWFGVGNSLLRRVSLDEVAFVPSPSSFSLAAARMGWALQETACISLHGRPVSALALHLAPGAQLLCLTSDAKTVADAADVLNAHGFGGSEVTVLGHLGGARESLQPADAPSLPDLNVMAISCVADAGHQPLSRVPGLPDEAFEHDGKMTKRDVRAMVLSRLAPQPGQHLWDIGAGCGSVAVEWLRSGDRMRATGLEPHDARRAMAARNALHLGVPMLDLRPDLAPAGLIGLDAPDAIFIGGGVSDRTVVDAAWTALPRGGRLVANAVTVEGQTVLTAAWQDLGGDLSRIMLERAGPVGQMNGWRTAMPVMQWSVVRP